jgi:hypothetical protein
MMACAWFALTRSPRHPLRGYRRRAAIGSYRGVLAELHQTRRPRTYVEVGVADGATLALAGDRTLCIGVDPAPDVPESIACRVHIETMTSDEFFSGPSVGEVLGGQAIDLAFIDGMHLFEYALRDFMSLEAHAGPESLIAVHDCLPRDEVSSSRERHSSYWTGDVWKLVVCLLDYRPDLEISMLDVTPSGLCLIGGLQASDTTLRDNYATIVERYMPMTFADWLASRVRIPLHRPALRGHPLRLSGVPPTAGR